ncbi:structural maintenance of chromosomes protein 4-like [Liolophura sinensis]|uniref:structural maintenance of chromosomes protein 4-like n=1 Tax=Liolophura sinensis TaxID=3198878 RepID=UPI00315822D8
MPGRKKTTKVSTAQAVKSVESREEEVTEEGDLGGGGDGAQEVGMDVDQDFSTGSTFLRREFNPEDYGTIEVPPAPEKVATYDVNGPRLMITHIENENFKSYAGKQTLGPFHKSFTSIVGPNGSGKSNVIDSMLFVFGFRANKIRSKKISVLIHNSDEHRDTQSCTVAVHFQKIIDTGSGENDYEVVPNSKFVVSRTAGRDNSSYYCVNGKRATWKEVATLLRGNGIDLDHNRFLILQGEVEQIAMMKPKGQTEHDEGMLEFLEDIIGSSRYQEPIEQLSKRVEELNELRGEKLNRVKTVEKEKDNLEGPKNEALEYLRLENEIIRQKNTLYQKFLHVFSHEEQKAVEERDRIKEGMTGLTTKLDELSSQKKEKNKDLQEIYKEYEATVKACEERKDEFAEFEKQDVKCREDFKHCKANAKKLEKSLEQEKKKVEELQKVPEQSEKAMERLTKELEEKEVNKAKEEEKLKAVMDSLKTETQGLQEEKEKSQEELLVLQTAVNETKSKFEVAQSELDIYLSNQQSEKNKLETAQKNLERTTTLLKERKKEVAEFEQKIPEAEKSLKQIHNDLQTAIQTEAQATQELKDLRVKVETAKSSMEASKSRGKVLEALMVEKRSGKLAGVSGRLGDLGGIDEKYDVAISTACGSLDNIVVDTIDTAQKCVEFLKKNNVGSATFIGLDKMQKWKEHAKRKIQTPEGVPRLFDLVKVRDENIRMAFYFALRDTLVANDLEQATRIAYGKTRFRVVTLHGQLIDTSGTMSGGGKSVSKGRMGSSAVSQEFNPTQVKVMETNLEKLMMEAQQVRDNKNKLEETVHSVEKSVTQMKHTLAKHKMEIAAMTEDEVQLKGQIQEQEAKVKAAAPDEKTLKDMQTKVNNYKKDYDKATAVASKVEAVVQKLHNQIMEIGGSKMSAAQSRVDAITAQIDETTGQITKLKVGIKTAERNLKKAETKMKSLEDDIQENQEKLVTLENHFKQLEVDATKVLESYQTAQEQIKVIEKTLEEIKGEITKVEEEETALQKDNVNVKHELEKREAKVKESQANIKHWKKELGKLTLHKIEKDDCEELPTLSEDDLEAVNQKDVDYKVMVAEEQLADMKPNMAAIEEFKKKEEVYLQRVAELEHITEFRNQQRQYHEELRKQRLDEFMAGFSLITNKLKEMYRMITLGGDAELELVDSLDPFSEGIVFSVRPPNKSWKNISNLSGGEKTLSSLALVFALHHYKPTPLYVMDEIDAALDFRNVSIVGNYIKERTRNAQFIIISLRNNMFELADRLVGIYKTYNCTKSVTINPEKLSLPLQPINV